MEARSDGGRNHVTGLGALEEREGPIAILEIEVARRHPDEVGEARRLEAAPEGGVDQPTVASDVERGIAVVWAGGELHPAVGGDHAVPHDASFTRSIQGEPAHASASISASTMSLASSRPSTAASQPS